ncbi:hypothetical protein FA15DRAFT_58793 [Coprinopsis marcescibilis]|uniref:DUF4360 domain-containing protein n=1 Tax=Coprinopsis marcescibilis TaxID=230819 RepID=A0A5C3L6K4_COPMA|nr:hypothetical protein FA15DRAFT_58793 [Coprinopsis marcescibilis]
MFSPILAVLPFVMLAMAVPRPQAIQRSVEVDSSVIPSSPPPGFNITSFGLIGTGCTPGSTYYTINPEKGVLDAHFGEFAAEVGPGIPISQNRKNCRLTFGIKVPRGFAFGVESLDTRGAYHLDKSVTATRQALYYFQGQVAQATSRTTFTGPVYEEDYDFSDNFDLVSTVVSPCGADTVLNIQIEVRASNSANTKGRGYIETYTASTFKLKWQICGPQDAPPQISTDITRSLETLTQSSVSRTLEYPTSEVTRTVDVTTSPDSTRTLSDTTASDITRTIDNPEPSASTRTPDEPTPSISSTEGPSSSLVTVEEPTSTVEGEPTSSVDVSTILEEPTTSSDVSRTPEIPAPSDATRSLESATPSPEVSRTLEVPEPSGRIPFPGNH